MRIKCSWVYKVQTKYSRSPVCKNNATFTIRGDPYCRNHTGPALLDTVLDDSNLMQHNGVKRLTL